MLGRQAVGESNNFDRSAIRPVTRLGRLGPVELGNDHVADNVHFSNLDTELRMLLAGKPDHAGEFIWTDEFPAADTLVVQVLRRENQGHARYVRPC